MRIATSSVEFSASCRKHNTERTCRKVFDISVLAGTCGVDVVPFEEREKEEVDPGMRVMEGCSIQSAMSEKTSLRVRCESGTGVGVAVSVAECERFTVCGRLRTSLALSDKLAKKCHINMCVLGAGPIVWGYVLVLGSALWYDGRICDSWGTSWTVRVPSGFFRSNDCLNPSSSRILRKCFPVFSSKLLCISLN